MSEGVAGYMVMIVVLPLAPGGTPGHIPCVVAEADPADAVNLVKSAAWHDNEVQAVGPLPQSYLDAFGLKPGEFTHWRLKP